MRRNRCRWRSIEQLSNSSPFEYGFLIDGGENAFCALCDLLCGEVTRPSRTIVYTQTSVAAVFLRQIELNMIGAKSVKIPWRSLIARLKELRNC